jgi:hypothetical protein
MGNASGLGGVGGGAPGVSVHQNGEVWPGLSCDMSVLNSHVLNLLKNNNMNMHNNDNANNTNNHMLSMLMLPLSSPQAQVFTRRHAFAQSLLPLGPVLAPSWPCACSLLALCMRPLPPTALQLRTYTAG